MKCEYCQNNSYNSDARGNCIACGAPKQITIEYIIVGETIQVTDHEWRISLLKYANSNAPIPYKLLNL